MCSYLKSYSYDKETKKVITFRRKRISKQKVGRGGKQSVGQGKKPIYVSTKTKEIKESKMIKLKKDDSRKYSKKI